MPKGIRIDFLADVRDFLRGTKDIEDSLDDVADSLDDLAKDAADAGAKAGQDLADGVTDALDDLPADAAKAGNKAGQELGDGIGDGVKDAGKALDKLEKGFKDALDDVGKQSKTAGDNLGDGVKKGAKAASEGMDDFKANTQSNLKETAASFSSVEDALGGIQGLASEALEGFGPAGAAAGAAVALGLGLATSKLQQIAEKTNEAAEKASAFAVAWRGATDDQARAQLLADRFEEVASAISDSRRAWELWQNRAVTQAEQFSDAIHTGVISAAELGTAFTDLSPQQRLEALTEASAKLGDELRALGQLSPIDQAVVEGTKRAATGVQDYEGALKGSKKAIDEQIKAENEQKIMLDAQAAALGVSAGELAEHQKATEKATEIQDAYNDSLTELADPVAAYEDLLADKSAADRKQAEAQAKATKDARRDWTDFSKDVKVTIDDMIKDVNAQILAKNKFAENLSRIAGQGGQALADGLRAKGPEVAGAAAAAIAAGSNKKIRELARQSGILTGGETGSAIGTGVKSKQAVMDKAVKDAVNHATNAANPNPVKVKVTADTSQAKRDIEALSRQVVRVDVGTGRKGVPVD